MSDFSTFTSFIKHFSFIQVNKHEKVEVPLMDRTVRVELSERAQSELAVSNRALLRVRGAQRELAVSNRALLASKWHPG